MSIADEIKASGLFDRDWYTTRNPDVALSGIQPLAHFIRVGMKIGRDPGPKFQTDYYLSQVPREELEGLAPFLHYLRVGRVRGLSPCPAARTVAASPPGAGGTAPQIDAPVFRHGRDVFMLRGLRPMAEVAVAVNAAREAEWSRALEVLPRIGVPHDLFLLGNVDAKGVPHNSLTVSVTETGRADEPGNAAAFLRLASSNVFDDYRAVLWLDPAGDHDRDMADRIAMTEAFCADPDWGLAGAVDETITETGEGKLLNALRTALPRLGLPFPEKGVALSSGAAIWLKPLLLRGLAPALNPDAQEVCSGQLSVSRSLLLGLLSVLAGEADLAVRDQPPVVVEGAFAATAAAQPREVKTIAFYLPQFHPIPENDLWWGKGFTEWSNVTRARPLFRDHYQPRVPTELGYYDLRLEDTQVAQAQLASEFGIHGFCYYYYWFDGKKLLNHPIEQMARSTKIDTGFCVCWANENWSRNWDGQNRHVLMEQTYTLDSNIALIRELIPMMKDPRWIRHNGKPVMMVYRISIIPNWLETAAAWREECRKAGLGEIHLCAVRFGLETLQGGPQDHDLDSYVLFPPHEAERLDLRDKVSNLHKDFNGQIFDYTAVVDGDLKNFSAGYDWPVHRGAMLAWDNTARRLTDARVFHGATPFGFRRWIKGILEQERSHNPDGESLVFVNAWNEWAEGTYLEPDQRWGRSYLKAISSAFEAMPDTVARVLSGPARPDRLQSGEGS